MPITDKPELLDSKQAAEFLNLSPDTLAVWRCTRRYDLPYVKVGHSVAYDLRDLLAFIERRKVHRKEPR
jgi:hypothetical protein